VLGDLRLGGLIAGVERIVEGYVDAGGYYTSSMSIFPSV